MMQKKKQFNRRQSFFFVFILFFWRSSVFGRKKTLNLRFGPEKAFEFRQRPFFKFFWNHWIFTAPQSNSRPIKIWVKLNKIGSNFKKSLSFCEILATRQILTKVLSMLQNRPPCKILQFKSWLYLFCGLLSSTEIVKFCMRGRFCSIDRTLGKIRGVARILQRERLFWKFDPILFDLQKKRSSPKFKRFFWPKSQIQGFSPAKNMWSPKKKVFAEFQTLFPLAEISNSRVFSG